MNIVFGLLFIIVGILNILIPERMIKYRHLALYKTEPTAFTKSAARIGGAVLAIIGIVLLYRGLN